MFTTVKQLRKQIKKIILEIENTNKPNTENIELMDDKAFNKESLLVPNDIKDSIKKWAKKMHLAK